MICREKIWVKHSTPCGHEFCYLCIGRHLRRMEFCPVCHEGPYGVCDLATAHKPNGIGVRTKQPHLRAERSLRRELRRSGTREVVNKDVLDWGFNELCVFLGSSVLRDTSLSMESVGGYVSRGERPLMKVWRSNESKTVEGLCRLKEYMKSLRSSGGDVRRDA